MYNNLYFKRVFRHLTQQELASLSGVSRKTICRLEQGVGCPSYRTAVKLCRALEVGVEEVFFQDVLL